jgi:hypothetical protein
MQAEKEDSIIKEHGIASSVKRNLTPPCLSHRQEYQICINEKNLIIDDGVPRVTCVISEISSLVAETQGLRFA